MLFRLIFLFSVVVAVVAKSMSREYYEKDFYDHVIQYDLKFSNGEEFVKRLDVFATNMEAIQAHNSGNNSYSLGKNQFSHLTFPEFTSAVKLGLKRPNEKRVSQHVHTAPSDVSSLPSEIDWVSKGAVTDVKNQGNCGSCWSFSTTGSLEGAYFIKYGSLVSLSEQELVSCDTTDTGCNGGWMPDAFTWTKKNGGLTTEESYPYTSGTNGQAGSCVTTGYSINSKVAPVSYTDVLPSSMVALMSAVSKQPVAIAIQANEGAFQSYSGGVLTGACGQDLDHGVLLVGYGTLNGIDYWKVKNSWGPSWGLGGYILIERSKENLCGILLAPSYPNL